MKVLLTGAGGQVAQALVRTCPSDTVIDARTRGQLDVTDGAAVRTEVSRGYDAVINCAAYTAVDRAETESDAAFQINARAGEVLATACARAGARLVHFSSDFVFAGDSSVPYTPDAPTGPLSIYGRTKLVGEQAALAAGALVIRTAWVYAATGANFVNTMLRLMAANAEVRVVADQIGTPTHALSLARTTWALLQANVTGLWHATDAGVASWYDFAVAIQDRALERELLTSRASIVPIATADYPTPAARPKFSVLDKSATWALLGTPAAHWRHELHAMLEEVRQPAHV